MNNRFLTFAAAVGIVCFTGFTAGAHHGPDGFDRTMQVIDRVTRILFPPVTVVTPAPAPVVVAPAPPVYVAPPVYMAPPPPPPRPRCDWGRPPQHRPGPPPRPGHGGHR